MPLSNELSEQREGVKDATLAETAPFLNSEC